MPSPRASSGDFTRSVGGLPQDYAEAMKWYLKAADQGDVYAQYELGIMYAEGNGGPLPRTADAQTYPSSRLGSPTTTRFIRTRLSDIVRPASSSKLAEVRDRVRSFGGYIRMDMPEWMQENCKLLVLTSSFKGENTTMSFPLNCNVARAAFGFCRFSPKEKIAFG